jgi:hypothetical protein
MIINLLFVLDRQMTKALEKKDAMLDARQDYLGVLSETTG